MELVVAEPKVEKGQGELCEVDLDQSSNQLHGETLKSTARRDIEVANLKAK